MRSSLLSPSSPSSLCRSRPPLLLLLLLPALALAGRCRGPDGLPNGPCTLRQRDFDQGTVILTQPGVYTLGQDIEFNPNSRAQGGNSMPRPDQPAYRSPAFRLGFFAAIVIQGRGITLDLNGRELRQSREHYLQQRFYANIELASSPFVFGQGPATFVEAEEDFSPAELVVVKNGRLGRSSHHGIHGNNADGVLLEDLNIADFEVAAVHLNAGVHQTIQGCTMGPTARDVPVVGLFSNAKFIRPYVEALAMAGEMDEMPLPVVVQNVSYTPAEVLAALDALVEATFQAFVVAEDAGVVPALVANPGGLPDGGSVYGLVLHSRGAAVNGLQQTVAEPAVNRHTFVSNSVVRGIVARPREVVALDTGAGAPVTDPVGAVFQWTKAVALAPAGALGTGAGGSAQVVPVGNPVANAQLLVARNAPWLAAHTSLDVSRNSISQTLVDWFAAEVQAPNSLPAALCNGDTMFHLAKGVFGVRVDAATHVTLQDVAVLDIQNRGAAGSPLCGDYTAATSHPAATEPGFLASRAFGINLAAARGASAYDVHVCSVHAAQGHSFGLRAHHGSSALAGTMAITDVTVGTQPLPAGAPHQPPVARAADAQAPHNRLAVLFPDTCGANNNN